MHDKYGKFSDDQTLTNLDSTGEMSSANPGVDDNYWDLEEDAAVDAMVQGCLMVTIISAVLTSGLTEGMIVGVRIDDAVDLATAQNGSTTGFKDVGMKHILKEEIVAGRTFAIPFIFDVATRGKYLAAWYKAHTTALVGNIHVESWFEESPGDSRKNIQKKPS